ncbi:MAG: energy transducer TonB [Syntrophaceae bacterium]|nr:energy transducer TonB [Syntrophaceae bacterium]
MTYHIRAFKISIILHILLIGAVVSAGSLMKEPCPLRVISFDIAKAGVKEIDFSKPPSAPLKKQARIKEVQLHTPKEPEKIIPDEIVKTSPTSEVPLPEPAPVMSGEQTASLSRQEIDGNTESGDSMGDGVLQGQEGEGALQERYLREHFLYIKERILRRIVYPNLARRMGWHGRVLTSFVIHADGSVSDIKVLNSSGFKVLDQNAVSTIEDASPFPRPPIAAKIIIPITYRLRPG